MRFLLPPMVLLTAACGQSDAPGNQVDAEGRPEAIVDAHWTGGGRDRMCMKNERAGLIVYAAEGDANCSLSGNAERNGDNSRIRPDGDQSCVIEARREGSALVLGSVTAACAYYCGPKASYAGKRFEMQAGTSSTVDLAGEPLC
jgi:hypothetical protein